MTSLGVLALGRRAELYSVHGGLAQIAENGQADTSCNPIVEYLFCVLACRQCQEERPRPEIPCLYYQFQKRVQADAFLLITYNYSAIATKGAAAVATVFPMS